LNKGFENNNIFDLPFDKNFDNNNLNSKIGLNKAFNKDLKRGS